MPLRFAGSVPAVNWSSADWGAQSTASTCNFIWHPLTAGWATAATTTITYTNTATTWANAGNWIVYDEVTALVVPRPPGILSAKTKRRYRREQREALRLQEEMNRAAAQRLEEGQRAIKRARALLFSALTRDQQRSLEERQYFDLNIGGKTYRIKQGTHGNVRLVQGDVETMLYCAQPPDVPAEDAMLAQKLMLETDEQAFLRVANARVLARAA